MISFLKGIVVGLGAVAPGLSGSVLLVIFGLYRRTITAVSSMFKDFKNSIKFLLPLAAGIAIGIILFSKLVDWLLFDFEMQTRFAFLGLILGSIPMFYTEVRKQGFPKKYYLAVAAGLIFGILLFNVNKNAFPVVTQPTTAQSVLLGFAVSVSYIVPGVDSAAILSALGLYNLWVHALATLDFSVLLPALAGVAVGVLLVSFVIDWLMKKCYTLSFSVIFGLFLSIVPAVLNESCVLGFNSKTYVSLAVFAVSFVASLFFGSKTKKK